MYILLYYCFEGKEGYKWVVCVLHFKMEVHFNFFPLSLIRKFFYFPSITVTKLYKSHFIRKLKIPCLYKTELKVHLLAFVIHAVRPTNLFCTSLFPRQLLDSFHVSQFLLSVFIFKLFATIKSLQLNYFALITYKSSLCWFI